MDLSKALTYARLSCAESAAEHENLQMRDEAQKRRDAREVLRENHFVLDAAPLLLAALQAYVRAGFGNSTDIHKQHDAYVLAMDAFEKAKSGL